MRTKTRENNGLESGEWLCAFVVFFCTMVRFFPSSAKQYDDANGTQKLHSRFLNKFAIIATHLVCVMWATYPGAEKRPR